MYAFLVNQNAANGRALKVWMKIKPILDERQVRYHIHVARDVDDAFNFIQTLPPHVSTLVLVGGDGTVQRVLGEAQRRNLHLGLIPAGSGNDLARAMGIPLDPRRALEHLLRGTACSMDVIDCNQQLYATAIGVGLDGTIAYTVNHSWYKKWLNRFGLGRAAYVIALFQVLCHFKPRSVDVYLDQSCEHLTGVWLISVHNCPSYGGGMKLCPQADFQDGRLNVCVVQHLNRLQLIRMFPKVYRGTHVGHPAIRMFAATKVRIDAADAMLAHGDGELVGSTPIVVEIKPAATYIVGFENRPEH